MGHSHLASNHGASDIACREALGLGPAINHGFTAPIAPDCIKGSANEPVDLDLQNVLDQFPSEDTLTTIGDRSDPIVAESPVRLLDIDPKHALEEFVSEGRLLVVIPAGPVVVYPCSSKRSQRGAASPCHGAVRHLLTVTEGGATSFAHMLSSTAWLTRRVARGLWSSASLGVVAVWSAASRFGIQIASLVQSLGRFAIDGCGQLRTNATAFIAKIGGMVGRGTQQAVQRASTATIAIRRGTHGIQAGLVLSRALSATERWIQTQLDDMWTLTGHVFGGLSRRVRLMRRTRTIRAASRQSPFGLRDALAWTARLVGTPPVIVAIVTAPALFTWTHWRVPVGAPPLATASLAVPLAIAPLELRSDVSTTLVAARVPTTVNENSPGNSGRAENAERIESIQRLLNRYRDAHSTLDVSAMRAVSPTVDTLVLRTAFDQLDDYNVDYAACQISPGDAQAHAVCSGIAQSRRVGERSVRTTNRQWRFVLKRVENRWRIASVVAR